MLRTVLLAVAVLGWNGSFLAAALPKPEELKVLDRLVGEWTTTGHVTNLGGEAKDLRTTGTASRAWALDGRIVEESATSSAGESFRIIFTYDVRTKAYRFFHFNSNGIVIAFHGKWDAAAQTLNFKSDLGDGVTQVASITFADNDHHRWASKVTDREGKVLFEGTGTVTRKK